MEHGLEARTCLSGLLIGPPLCIDAAQIADAIGIFDTILDEVDAALGLNVAQPLLLDRAEGERAGEVLLNQKAEEDDGECRRRRERRLHAVDAGVMVQDKAAP